MKILCICQGGNVRSATLGFVLKYAYGVDALAAGWEKNSPDTLLMLNGWADHVLIVEESHREKLPEAMRERAILIPVGPDRWFMSLHPELLDICQKLLAQAITVKTEEPATEEIVNA